MDVLEQAAGGTLIAAGAWLIWPPLAIILLGLMLLTHGMLIETKRIREGDADGHRELAPSDDSTRNS